MHAALLSLAIAMALLFGVILGTQVYTAVQSEDTTQANLMSPDAANQVYRRYSPMAKQLADPELKAEDHIQVVAQMIQETELLDPNEIPETTNQAITKALTTGNHSNTASLPSTHPSINENGELTDRWHTPYNFNPTAGRHITIRSAGRDKKFNTDDDLVWSTAASTKKTQSS